METVQALEGLDHYDRSLLAANPKTDLSRREGYYLNAACMRLAVIPPRARIVLTLTPSNADIYRRHVSFPPELQGVIFSGAPSLPDNYAAILAHWSPLEVDTLHEGAQYFQNPQNSYLVSFGPEAEPRHDGESADILLSDALVVVIRGCARIAAKADPEQFIEIHVPINTALLDADSEGYGAAEVLTGNPHQRCERIFLSVRDIVASPNPDYIAIAAIHTELWDYGYYY